MQIQFPLVIGGDLSFLGQPDMDTHSHLDSQLQVPTDSQVAPGQQPAAMECPVSSPPLTSGHLSSDDSSPTPLSVSDLRSSTTSAEVALPESDVAGPSSSAYHSVPLRRQIPAPLLGSPRSFHGSIQPP